MTPEEFNYIANEEYNYYSTETLKHESLFEGFQFIAGKRYSTLTNDCFNSEQEAEAIGIGLSNAIQSSMERRVQTFHGLSEDDFYCGETLSSGEVEYIRDELFIQAYGVVHYKTKDTAYTFSYGSSFSKSLLQNEEALSTLIEEINKSIDNQMTKYMQVSI